MDGGEIIPRFISNGLKFPADKERILKSLVNNFKSLIDTFYAGVTFFKTLYKNLGVPLKRDEHFFYYFGNPNKRIVQVPNGKTGKFNSGKNLQYEGFQFIACIMHNPFQFQVIVLRSRACRIHLAAPQKNRG
jgi:hypothetical protein